MTAGQTGIQPGSDDGFADELPPGTSLLQGQYEIEGFLNAGGFGVTYLARDSLDRKVVLKECYPSSMCCRSRNAVRARNRSAQKEFNSVVRLFGQEARRLSALKHPNIVGIHQVFEDKGTAYMALDFVRGRELLEIIEDPKVSLTPNQVRSVLKKSLSAVKYIHDNNVLHRDISPDNILIQANGNPVLIDFGAAREEATRASRALSQIQVVKDGYSPQEFYIAGSDHTPASDLYSLAATFYHLITGAPPPTSQERVAAIAAEKEDPYRPLINHIRTFDEHFLMAIDQAMCPFPKDRLATADAWIGMIDTVKRRRAALVKAEKDKNIEASIQALVAETIHAGSNPSGQLKTSGAHQKKRLPENAMPDQPVMAKRKRSFLARLFSRDRGENRHASRADTPNI